MAIWVDAILCYSWEVSVTERTVCVCVCVCVCFETHSGLALVRLEEGKREERSFQHVVNNIHETL